MWHIMNMQMSYANDKSMWAGSAIAMPKAVGADQPANAAHTRLSGAISAWSLSYTLLVNPGRSAAWHVMMQSSLPSHIHHEWHVIAMLNAWDPQRFLLESRQWRSQGVVQRMRVSLCAVLQWQTDR